MFTKSMITGIRNYKYSCVDSSPLSNYVMHPFWNWMVQFYPVTWAPNSITLAGFVLTFLHFGILSYYNPNFGSPDAVPSIVWLFCGILVFVAHTLDGTDGKQARRLKLSSPLGELFDHGCDSWAVYFIPAVVFSMADNSSVGWRLFIVFWFLVLTFFINHLEKYFTGVLVLPWTYDFGQLLVTMVCLLQSIFPTSIMSTPLVYTVTASIFFEASLYVSFVIQLASSIHTILSTRSHDVTPNSWHSVRYWLSPCLPMLVLVASSLFWATFSPDNVLVKQPRLFYYCLATVASNVCCELILAQMGQVTAPSCNRFVLAYAAMAILACGLPLVVTAYKVEDVLLRLVALGVTVAHLHYGVQTTYSIADVLGISPFSVKATPVTKVPSTASCGHD